MLEATLIGYVDIPGEYKIIQSAIVDNFFFWIIERDIKGVFELWKIDMNNAQAKLVHIRPVGDK